MTQNLSQQPWCFCFCFLVFLFYKFRQHKGARPFSASFYLKNVTDGLNAESFSYSKMEAIASDKVDIAYSLSLACAWMTASSAYICQVIPGKTTSVALYHTVNPITCYQCLDERITRKLKIVVASCEPKYK